MPEGRRVQGPAARQGHGASNGDSTRPLVELRDLTKLFPLRRGVFGGPREHVRAVDSVSLDIHRGETLALVGESGCGKSTLARLILRLVEPTSGRLLYDGADVLTLDGPGLKALRRRAQIIFQDPFSSLNPRMTVGAAIREVFRVHGLARGRDAAEGATSLLESVGLHPEDVDRYPHEFSGGQRQRIGIARALAVEPEFIVADEPVSALDVSVRAQVLNLLIDLQRRLGLTFLFIGHDLSVVRQIADRVAVMYLGHLVEVGPAEAVFDRPLHPYTRALLSAVPTPGERSLGRRIALRGDPLLQQPSTGCPFFPRCPHPEKDERCQTESPALRAGPGGALVACHKAPHPRSERSRQP